MSIHFRTFVSFVPIFGLHETHSSKTNDNEVGSDKSHPGEAVPEVMPNKNEIVQHYLCRSPSRPNIDATLYGGRKITIPQNIFDELAVSTRSPSCSSSNSNVISVHADVGCVELVVTGT